MSPTGHDKANEPAALGADEEPEEIRRPTPLVAVALVVALPATVVLALLGGLKAGGWAGGFALLLCGGVLVVLIGRGSLGVARTVVLTLGTWAALAVSGFVFLMVAVGQSWASCSDPTIASWGAAAVLASVFYAAFAYWSLRKGWWWGPALAVVLAFFFGVVVAQVLPRDANPNYPDSCSS